MTYFMNGSLCLVPINFSGHLVKNTSASSPIRRFTDQISTTPTNRHLDYRRMSSITIDRGIKDQRTKHCSQIEFTMNQQELV